MATNQYFSSSYNSLNNDQKLVESLIVESIQVYGVDVDYLPRSFVNTDILFGEDTLSAFNESIPIEMYVKTVDGFGGDGDFLSKFGIEIRDEVSLSVTIRRFDEEVTNNHSNIVKPREGDLLHLPTTVDEEGRIFEISFVETEEIYYQLGNLYTYEIRCRLFEYGGEDFNTGDPDIDAVEEDHAPTYVYKMVAGVGEYTIGETVTQVSGFTGEVVSWNGVELALKFVKGKANVSETIDGENTNRGLDAIDSGDKQQTYTFTMQTGVGDYVVGETIRQVSGFNGVVTAWNEPDLTLKDVSGSAKVTETFNGVSTTRLVVSIYPDVDENTGDDGTIDDGFNWDDSDLIDHSEDNPWSNN